MYQIIYNLMDKYDGQIVESDLICYTELVLNNINDILDRLNKRHEDEYECKIICVKDTKGIII